MTIIMALFVFAANYVRCAGGKNSYAGSVASFVVVEVLLMNKNGGTVTHTESDDFQMVEQCCMGVVIFVIVELLVFPKHGPELLREKIQSGLSQTFELEELQFNYAMEENGKTDGFTGVDISTHSTMVQKRGEGYATYINTDTTTKKHHALLLDMHEKLVADAGTIAAMDADYDASLKEPEVCRRVFGAECYGSVKDSVAAMHRCLQVMNIMYDDKLEYTVATSDENSQQQQISDANRVEIMQKCKATLQDVQDKINAIVMAPETGILEILKDEKASAAALDKALFTAFEKFKVSYDSARTDLLAKIQSKAVPMGLSPIDRLRLAAWYVSLRNVTEHLISIYRELTFYYWDRNLCKTSTLTDVKIDNLAGADKVMDAREYHDLVKDVNEDYYFIPSGSRYS